MESENSQRPERILWLEIEYRNEYRKNGIIKQSSVGCPRHDDPRKDFWHAGITRMW